MRSIGHILIAACAQKEPEVPSHISYLWTELRLRVHERVDVAEALVPVLQEILGGLGEQRLHVPVKRLV
jgi:hypothetical protein